MVAKSQATAACDRKNSVQVTFERVGAGNSVVAFDQGKHWPVRDQRHPMPRAHPRVPKCRLTRQDTVSGTHNVQDRPE